MEYETAGDPITGLKWTRKTTEKVTNELKVLGIKEVNRTSVARLLKELGYSLKVNHKKRALTANKTPEARWQRNQQFEYINLLRTQFADQGNPIISVDSKKKEMVGDFKNNGATWRKRAFEVSDHDFRQYAEGIAIGYGIYDVLANRGSMFVGIHHDTPAFAVESIAKWWKQDGEKEYGGRKSLLILADAGGSNGYRPRAWKYELQHKLCDRFGLDVTVCHYPPGASKWNPIEHRLFSAISNNWEGVPLNSYEKILKYMRTTKTNPKNGNGLKVKATLIRKKYSNGQKVSDKEIVQLQLKKHDTLPSWNYSFSPTEM
jgi:uncharacterized protein (DUF736 family)